MLLLCTIVLCELRAQAPVNDNCANAFTLDTVSGWCSRVAQFTTIGATPTQGLAVPRCTPQNSTPNDVWFVFDAIGTDVNISVSGATRINGGGTLRSPQFALYTGTCGNLRETNDCISDARSRNTVQSFASNLIIGQRTISGSVREVEKVLFNCVSITSPLRRHQVAIVQPGISFVAKKR
jgi:hypothetical protein